LGNNLKKALIADSEVKSSKNAAKSGIWREQVM